MGSEMCIRDSLNCTSRGYGIEQEQIKIAMERNMKIVEVGIKCNYDVKNRSKKRAISQGAELTMNIIRLVVEENPLRYLGIPGLISMILGIILSSYMILLFNETRYFSVPIALITLGALFTGLTLILTSLTLYAIKRSR